MDAADRRRAEATDASEVTLEAIKRQSQAPSGASITPTANIGVKMRMTASCTCASVAAPAWIAARTWLLFM